MPPGGIRNHNLSKRPATSANNVCKWRGLYEILGCHSGFEASEMWSSVFGSVVPDVCWRHLQGHASIGRRILIHHEVKGKVSQNTTSFIGVNKTTCFGLLGGHHQVWQSSMRLNIVCVWRMLRSHYLAYKLYMRQTVFEQIRQWTCVGMWYPGRGSSPLGSVVFGIGGRGPDGD